MISTSAASATAPANDVRVQRIWAELTGNWQLGCTATRTPGRPEATGR